MTLSKSTLALTASLCVILIFVFAINLSSTSFATAFGDSDANASFPRQQEDEGEEQEGKKQEEDEDEEQGEEEKWEDEQEGDDDEEGEEGEEQEEDEDEGDEDEGEEEEGEWEMELAEIQMERAGVESNIGRLELITRFTEIANDDSKMAGYAIMHVGEFLEPEESVTLLEKVVESQESPKAIRNLAKMKLAEMYAELDRGDDVKALLKSILKIK